MVSTTSWPLFVVLSFVSRVLGSASMTTVIDPVAGPLGLAAACPAGAAAGLATGAAPGAAGLAAAGAAGAGALGAAGWAGGEQASNRLARTVKEIALVAAPQPRRFGGEVRPLVVVLRIRMVSPSLPLEAKQMN